ncbi:MULTISPECIES: helix-turn-helix transcriptional regulator [Terrabacteria group]|uniref:helix-turn-helix domain-containing protein n=1 Tax=Bacillati TaxID=1783272 RepID=UPI0027D21503|nr:helix-turn-helix transcriptional regulator [Trueperella sp. zg.1013]
MKLEKTQVFVIIKQDKKVREDSMNISYEPLWNLLKSRNMKKKDLLEKASLTSNCIANMGKNEYISLKNIEKICKALKCNIGDIVEFNLGGNNE